MNQIDIILRNHSAVLRSLRDKLTRGEVIPTSLSLEAYPTTNGDFTMNITPSILEFTGPKDISLLVTPLDPMYEESTSTIRIYCIGLFGPLLALVLAVALLRPMLRQAFSRTGEVTPVKNTTELKPTKHKPMSLDPFARLYFSAVKLIESKLGVRMLPH